MASEAIWAKRVAAWRASGLTAAQFCARYEYAAGTLRWWSSRLGRARAPRPQDRVPIARVIAVPSVPAGPATLCSERVSADAETVVIEIGAARVHMPLGCEHPSLEAVLDILLARAARAGR